MSAPILRPEIPAALTPLQPVPVPSRVPALADALSGVTTNRSPVADLLRLRAQILGQRGSDFWTAWAKRLFQEAP